jgi:D-3-phosphoglycerate dehydrogenase
MEVLEKTIGIVGLGQIGREVAKRCQGLGMFVIGYDPLMQKDAALKLGIELVSLDELYRRSDFITVHTPLNNETRGLINDASISLCRKGIRFLNCARGGIIDEAALLRGLQSGHVGGAALDVFEKEPPDQSALLRHEKVVVTPHLGASTEEAQEKVAAQIARQVADALMERAYAGVVNASILNLTIKEGVKPFLALSEKMGSLAAQLLTGKVRGISISAEGKMVSDAVELLKAGALRGMLPHFIPDPVNVINAPFLAREMGINVQEQRREDGRELLNSLSVMVETDRGKVDLMGTVFGSSSVRLVQIDGFRVEVNPEGYLLIYRNIDKPGFLARVGTILAASGVNIGGVSLGRTAAGAMALTVMNVDDPISQTLLGELSGLEGVTDLKFADLGSLL